MVRVIVADRKIDCEHLLGTFLGPEHFDILVEEDCDGYMPAGCDLSERIECETECGECEKGTDERRIAFKFRKNYFSKELQDMAYDGLRDAATASQNRGLAAGPKGAQCGNRDWVKGYEFDIIELLMNTTENLFGQDPIEEALDKVKAGEYVEQSSRGYVWKTASKEKENFEFFAWVEKTRKLPLEERISEAKRVSTVLISMTTYANAVDSGIAGWFDRYPRIPYGRATAYTANNKEKFEKSFPFLQRLSEGFSTLLPKRFKAQSTAAAGIDPRFVVPGTPFTTLTVNKTFRTAAHRDAGDFSDGLSNLLVLSNDGNYTGGYLVFPEYRVAVNVRPGDLLLVNNHEIIHGNTPIVPGSEKSERVSIVCYLREGMLELGSKEYEDARYNFVESRRLNKDHPLWRPLWNGVSEGQWQSDEWYNYLLDQPNGEEMCKKYQPELWEAKNASSLEDFFG